MNILRMRWLVALGATLALALLYLYVRTQHHDAPHYFEDIALLRQVKQLDATWELDVLKSRVGTSRNYDALVEPLPELQLLPAQMHKLLEGSMRNTDVPLASAIEQFQHALNDKAALIESFKSHNAILNNSVAFLPIAANELLGLLAAIGMPHASLVNKLMLQTLTYEDQESSEIAYQEIVAGLDTLTLRTRGAPAAVRERVRTFCDHAHVVLREHDLVDSLLEQIAKAPTARHLDRIDALLTVHERLAHQDTQRFRLYLFAFSAALISLLLFAALRLVRSHATIRRINAELLAANSGLEQRVQARTAELGLSNARLAAQHAERADLQSRMVQTEKLAALGQLSAGVAHEINNPLGFLASNIGMLEQYFATLLTLFARYEQAESALPAHTAAALRLAREQAQLGYLREDIPLLMRQSKDGMARVSTIVQSLNAFSRNDSQQQWQWTDLHKGIDSTLVIINHQLRQVADISKQYGALPQVLCLPSEINQVVMNLLVNAGQAFGPQRGQIAIRTGISEGEAWIEVEDNGCGMSAATQAHIFDPFYTTKPIGTGTGLGLSISYGLVERHHGRIEVDSIEGRGSRFRICLPIGDLVQAGALPDEASCCHQRHATMALAT